jgi:hypothetical protein
MNCDYCHEPVLKDAKKCNRCGAPIALKEETWRGDPFYFRGFFIWPENHPASRMVIYYVYAGERVVGKFDITYDAFEEWNGKNGTLVDTDPLIYKLLRLAIGDSEVERIEALNNPRWISFEIRKIESPDRVEAREWLRNLNLNA